MKVRRWCRSILGLSMSRVTALVAFGACGTIVAVEGETPDPSTPSSIDLQALGGIAALRITYHVDSASGDVSYQMGPWCETGADCRTNLSLAGRLDRAAVDALFARTATPEFRALRADYGTTRNAADMQTHVVTIHANARARSMQADDGTMPTLMAQFVNDVRSAVTEAVKK